MLTTVQKLQKSIEIFQSYNHKCILPPFYGSRCIMHVYVNYKLDYMIINIANSFASCRLDEPVV